MGILDKFRLDDRVALVTSGLAVFLASNASSFITGTGILIDGGLTAR